MLGTDPPPVRSTDDAFNIWPQQYPALGTRLGLNSRWIFPPIPLKVVSICSVTDVLFEDCELFFALRTTTPITRVVVLSVMQTAERVFTMIARTNTENVPLKALFRGIANCSVAAISFLKRTVFSTKSAVRV